MGIYYLSWCIHYQTLSQPEQKLRIVQLKVSTAEWLALQSPYVQVSGFVNER